MNLVAEDDLEPLITECPNCHTRFRVAESQLQSARGKVRCGACLSVFNGVEHLVWEQAEGFSSAEEARNALDVLLSELEETAEDRVSERVGATTPPDQIQPVPVFSGFEDEPLADLESARDEVLQGEQGTGEQGTGEDRIPEQHKDVHAASGAVASGQAVSTADLHSPAGANGAENESADAAEAPSSAEPAPVPPGRRSPTAGPTVVFGSTVRPRPLVWMGIALAALGILAQVFWYQFDAWSRTPLWRPVYAQLCGWFGCELPVQRAPALLRTRNLVVRSHPDEAGALAVNAIIVNEAAFAQPFPDLELRFTSMNGGLVARRVFEPREYLSGEAENMALMPALTPVQIQLDIADPGPDAVNYAMKIL